MIPSLPQTYLRVVTKTSNYRFSLESQDKLISVKVKQEMMLDRLKLMWSPIWLINLMSLSNHSRNPLKVLIKLIHPTSSLKNQLLLRQLIWDHWHNTRSYRRSMQDNNHLKCLVKDTESNYVDMSKKLRISREMLFSIKIMRSFLMWITRFKKVDRLTLPSLPWTWWKR